MLEARCSLCASCSGEALHRRARWHDSVRRRVSTKGQVCTAWTLPESRTLTRRARAPFHLTTLPPARSVVNVPHGALRIASARPLAHNAPLTLGNRRGRHLRRPPEVCRELARVVAAEHRQTNVPRRHRSDGDVCQLSFVLRVREVVRKYVDVFRVHYGYFRLCH